MNLVAAVQVRETLQRALENGANLRLGHLRKRRVNLGNTISDKWGSEIKETKERASLLCICGVALLALRFFLSLSRKAPSLRQRLSELLSCSLDGLSKHVAEPAEYAPARVQKRTVFFLSLIMSATDPPPQYSITICEEKRCGTERRGGKCC